MLGAMVPTQRMRPGSRRDRMLARACARTSTSACGGVLAVLVSLMLGPTAGRASPAAGTPAKGPADGPSIREASLSTVLEAVKAPGARAVLVNVWATWCDPCREELPDLLRFYRENRARGLRMVLVSADDLDQRATVREVLGAAARAAGLGRGELDATSFIKIDDDTVFVNGFDRAWSGALPATFVFDGAGKPRRGWLEPVRYVDLEARVSPMLRLTPAARRADSGVPARAAGAGIRTGAADNRQSR
jgi:thiol-disulfide isomerase/thioredoxin